MRQPHDTVVLMLACNDYRNGVFTGLCDAIKVLPSWRDDLLLELAGAAWRVRDGQGGLWIGHEHLTVARSKAWYGNWCWNAYEVSLREAARLITALCASPRWDIEAGETHLYNAWRRQDTQAGEWATLLRRALAGDFDHA